MVVAALVVICDFDAFSNLNTVFWRLHIYCGAGYYTIVTHVCVCVCYHNYSQIWVVLGLECLASCPQGRCSTFESSLSPFIKYFKFSYLHENL